MVTGSNHHYNYYDLLQNVAKVIRKWTSLELLKSVAIFIKIGVKYYKVRQSVAVHMQLLSLKKFKTCFIVSFFGKHY